MQIWWCINIHSEFLKGFFRFRIFFFTICLELVNIKKPPSLYVCRRVKKKNQKCRRGKEDILVRIKYLISKQEWNTAWSNKPRACKLCKPLRYGILPNTVSVYSLSRLQVNLSLYFRQLGSQWHVFRQFIWL